MHDDTQHEIPYRHAHTDRRYEKSYEQGLDDPRATIPDTIFSRCTCMTAFQGATRAMHT